MFGKSIVRFIELDVYGSENSKSSTAKRTQLLVNPQTIVSVWIDTESHPRPGEPQSTVHFTLGTGQEYVWKPTHGKFNWVSVKPDQAFSAFLKIINRSGKK